MKRARMLGAIAALIVVGAIPLLIEDQYTLGFFVLAGVFSLVVVGLDMLVGYGGQIALGHGGFMAIGAFSSAILTTRYHIPPLAALVAAVVVTALVALVLGVSTLRALTHFHLAVATLIFVMLINAILLIGGEYTGGFTGIQGIPSLGVGPLVVSGEVANYYLVWGVVLFGVLFAASLGNSQTGRILRAVQGDELGAQSLGIDVVWLKVKVFVLSAMYASVGGSLLAHYTKSVTPSQFDTGASLELLLMVFLGGKGTVIGGVVGASVLKLLPQVTEFLKDYRLLANGLILTVVILFAPRGIVGLVRSVIDAISRTMVVRGTRQRDGAVEAVSGETAGEMR